MVLLHSKCKVLGVSLHIKWQQRWLLPALSCFELVRITDKVNMTTRLFICIIAMPTSLRGNIHGSFTSEQRTDPSQLNYGVTQVQGMESENTSLIYFIPACVWSVTWLWFRTTKWPPCFLTKPWSLSLSLSSFRPFLGGGEGGTFCSYFHAYVYYVNEPIPGTTCFWRPLLLRDFHGGLKMSGSAVSLYHSNEWLLMLMLSFSI